MAIEALIAMTLLTLAGAREDAKGARCSDGTYYVGQHPDGSALYAAGCDVGMTPGPSGQCTGLRVMLTWGPMQTDSPLRNLDEAAAVPDFSGHERAVWDFSGRESTATLVRSGGYPAARECDRLSMNGHDDWYLPAADELDLLWAAMHDRARTYDNSAWALFWLPVSHSSKTAMAQTFDRRILSQEECSNGALYPCGVWSASEFNSNGAWGRDLLDGGRVNDGKRYSFAVRCVRR